MNAKLHYVTLVTIFFIVVLAISCSKNTGTGEPITREPITPSGSISIVKFWSLQFPTADNFNFLQRGAGIGGDVTKKIIMGTRDNSVAWAGCEVSVTNQQKLTLVKVRFSLDKGSGPILYGTSTSNGNRFSISLNTTEYELPPPGYQLLAWIDENKNDKVDNNEPHSLSDGSFVIVNRPLYNGLTNQLIANAHLAFRLPRSQAFAFAFLKNSPINYGGTFTSSLISYDALENSLKESHSYHVGVDLNTTGKALIRNFLFGLNSQLAKDIIASQTFRDTLSKTLERNKSYVHRDYCGQTFTFPLPKRLEYLGEDVPPFGIDQDLYTTFKSAVIDGQLTVKVTCKGVGEVVVDSLKIKGKLLDLYDFNYPNQLPLSYGHQMALVQGGYGTLGDAGQIFRTEVHLDTTIINDLK
jgi:hypothetical protein